MFEIAVYTSILILLCMGAVATLAFIIIEIGIWLRVLWNIVKRFSIDNLWNKIKCKFFRSATLLTESSERLSSVMGWDSENNPDSNVVSLVDPHYSSYIRFTRDNFITIDPSIHDISGQITQTTYVFRDSSRATIRMTDNNNKIEITLGDNLDVRRIGNTVEISPNTPNQGVSIAS